MAKKAAPESSRRQLLEQAAWELFLEKGFEATSIRMIAERAGCEVGLLYYYFKNKDEVFEAVLADRLAAAAERFAAVADGAVRDPYRALYCFFTELQRQAGKQPEKGALHWSMAEAIHSRLLQTARPRLAECLRILQGYGLIRGGEPDATADLLLHGMGAVLWLPEGTPGEYRRGQRQAAERLLGLPDGESYLVPFFAGFGDIPGWMALLEQVRGDFPALEPSTVEKHLPACIDAREALVLRNAENIIVGAAAFSRRTCKVDFLAVTPPYRGRGLGKSLLVTALAQLPAGSTVTVSLDGAPGPNREVADKLCRSLGFAPQQEGAPSGSAAETLALRLPQGRWPYLGRQSR